MLLPASLHAKNLPSTQQAASTGEARAQYDLAIRYLKGDGVAEDSTSAVKWLKKSAEQNFSSVHYKLGVLYYEGRMDENDAVPLPLLFPELKNEQGKEKPAIQAAEQGYAISQYHLGELLKKGKSAIKE